MIIGLSGPQRAGKTTVANILVEKHHARFMSIGDQLKTHAHELIGHRFYEDEKDVPHPLLGGKTPRELYIHVGQIDEFDGGLWVRKMFQEQYRGHDKLHVIESVGKPIQWKAVKNFCIENKLPCMVLDVQRKGTEYKDNRGGVNDPSWTYRLSNDGEIADLELEIAKKLDLFMTEPHGFIPE